MVSTTVPIRLACDLLGVDSRFFKSVTEGLSCYQVQELNVGAFNDEEDGGDLAYSLYRCSPSRCSTLNLIKRQHLFKFSQFMGVMAFFEASLSLLNA